MRRIRSNVVVVVALLALGAAACGSSSKASARATNTTTTTAISQPVTYGYYDGHVDWMLSTDVSSKTAAASSRINYAPKLVNQPAAKFPSLYLVGGRAAAGQPMVFGSEPGKDDYTPLWHETTVKWKPGVTPVLLKKDDQINELVGNGQLTAAPTGIVLNCPIVKVTTSTTVPKATTISQPVTYGYYDGHVDTMLSTDVSSKTAAASSHINYSAAMVTQPAGHFPSLYLVSGPAAAGQPMVFGSEPGKDDYTPLWDEVTVKWKPGVTPVLLTKDDQINELAGKGQLTVDPTLVVLNCPIVKMST
jgi:hypothetical protein